MEWWSNFRTGHWINCHTDLCFFIQVVCQVNTVLNQKTEKSINSYHQKKKNHYFSYFRLLETTQTLEVLKLSWYRKPTHLISDIHPSGLNFWLTSCTAFKMQASSSFWDSSKLSKASFSEGFFSDLDKTLFRSPMTALEEKDFFQNTPECSVITLSDCFTTSLKFFKLRYWSWKCSRFCPDKSLGDWFQ